MANKNKNTKPKADVEEEKVISEIEETDATGDVTRYGVYRGENLVSIFNSVNHGDDFIKLAKAKAKEIGGVAKAYIDPAEPVAEKNVVNIVNVNGNMVRQFSETVHGKDYQKLAEGYIEKHGEKKGLHIGA